VVIGGDDEDVEEMQMERCEEVEFKCGGREMR
jgi:hypothetical protein